MIFIWFPIFLSNTVSLLVMTLDDGGGDARSGTRFSASFSIIQKSTIITHEASKTNP